MSNDDNNRQLLLYTAPDGDVRVEVIYQDETVWLSQKSLAEQPRALSSSGVRQTMRPYSLIGQYNKDSIIME